MKTFTDRRKAHFFAKNLSVNGARFVVAEVPGQPDVLTVVNPYQVAHPYKLDAIEKQWQAQEARKRKRRERTT